MRMTARIAGGVGLLALAWAAPARAQDDGTKPPVAQRHVVSASPLLMMFKWFNVDYEGKISPAVTLGASGSYLPTGGGNYGRGTFHARYYPQGAALTGFYVGAQAGVHQTGVEQTRYRERHRTVFFGAGADVGYAWLFGRQRNVSLTLGIGTTRLFGGDLDGSSFVIPNIRLFNVGVAF
jgi:hypothetical protein